MTDVVGAYPFEPGQPAQLTHTPVEGMGSKPGPRLLAQKEVPLHRKGLEVELRGGQRGRGETVKLPFVNLAPVELEQARRDVDAGTLLPGQRYINGRTNHNAPVRTNTLMI